MLLVHSEMSENDPGEDVRHMSEDQSIETRVELFQFPLVQTGSLLLLFVLAVITPFLFIAVSSVIMGSVSLSDVPRLLFSIIVNLFSPYVVLNQWESFLFTCFLLTMIVLVWPKQVDEKAWCAGLVLFFHAIVGGGLIFMRNA